MLVHNQLDSNLNVMDTHMPEQVVRTVARVA